MACTIQPNGNGGATTCTRPDPQTQSDTVTCSEIYGQATTVTLTAAATTGTFDKWGADCSGNQATCNLTLDPAAQNPDKSVKAKFKP